MTDDDREQRQQRRRHHREAAVFDEIEIRSACQPLHTRSQRTASPFPSGSRKGGDYCFSSSRVSCFGVSAGSVSASPEVFMALRKLFTALPRSPPTSFNTLGAKDQRHDHEDDQQLRNAHRQTHTLSPFDGCSVARRNDILPGRVHEKPIRTPAASAVASSMRHIDHASCGSVHTAAANVRVRGCRLSRQKARCRSYLADRPNGFFADRGATGPRKQRGPLAAALRETGSLNPRRFALLSASPLRQERSHRIETPRISLDMGSPPLGC